MHYQPLSLTMANLEDYSYTPCTADISTFNFGGKIAMKHTLPLFSTVSVCTVFLYIYCVCRLDNPTQCLASQNATICLAYKYCWAPTILLSCDIELSIECWVITTSCYWSVLKLWLQFLGFFFVYFWQKPFLCDLVGPRGFKCLILLLLCLLGKVRHVFE